MVVLKEVSGGIAIACENDSWMNNTDNSHYSKIEKGIKELLHECVDVVVFDEQGTLLAGSYKPEAPEINILKNTFLDRQQSIKAGIFIKGARYEVHRWHPPLVYGRIMFGTPHESRGAAVIKVENQFDQKIYYAAMTYDLPNVSARMVPLLQQFAKQYIQKADIQSEPNYLQNSSPHSIESKTV